MDVHWRPRRPSTTRAARRVDRNIRSHPAYGTLLAVPSLAPPTGGAERVAALVQHLRLMNGVRRDHVLPANLRARDRKWPLTVVR